MSQGDCNGHVEISTGRSTWPCCHSRVATLTGGALDPVYLRVAGGGAPLGTLGAQAEPCQSGKGTERRIRAPRPASAAYFPVSGAWSAT